MGKVQGCVHRGHRKVRTKIIANLPNHSQENDVFLDHSPPAKLMANCIVKNKLRKLIKMAFT